MQPGREAALAPIQLKLFLRIYNKYQEKKNGDSNARND
jgi:hypothetical protein